MVLYRMRVEFEMHIVKFWFPAEPLSQSTKVSPVLQGLTGVGVGVGVDVGVGVGVLVGVGVAVAITTVVGVGVAVG